MYKIAIVGGRDFYSYPILKQKCDEILEGLTDEIMILSGKADGADSLGEEYARENGYSIGEYPAMWFDLKAKPCRIKRNHLGQKYNSLAGFNRNKEMVNDANLVIAFWDGISEGTKDTIERAKAAKIQVIVIKYRLKGVCDYDIS
jgi:hypothetical protein